MSSGERREPGRDEFRSFLSSVSACQVSVEEWNRFAIQRYVDPLLESMRQRLTNEVLARGQCSARTIPAGMNDVVAELIEELDADVG